MRAVALALLTVVTLVGCGAERPTQPAPGEAEQTKRPQRDAAPPLATPLALYDDRGFRPPDRDFRRAAIGSLEGLPPAHQRAFSETARDRPIAAPEPGDWLAEHHEAGQSFDMFQRAAPNRPDDARRTIYILPIGELGDAPVAQLARFTETYFGLPVSTLPATRPDALRVTERVHHGARQLLAPELLAQLKQRLPDDAYCLIGITDIDLYPDPEWNYVFGYASLSERVGVHSFARYDPAFHGLRASDDARAAAVLHRGAKVMAHDLGHMFGIEHCVFYDCVMNGSNNLEESDRQPLHLCPVCLRKLQSSVGFEPEARYRELAAQYSALELPRDVAGTRRRADAIATASE